MTRVRHVRERVPVCGVGGPGLGKPFAFPRPSGVPRVFEGFGDILQVKARLVVSQRLP